MKDKMINNHIKTKTIMRYKSGFSKNQLTRFNGRYLVKNTFFKIT